jgi:hypothetical protein
MSAMQRSRVRAGAPHSASARRGPCREAPTPSQQWQRWVHVYREGGAPSIREERLKRLSKEELVRLARSEDLPHRSKMNKAQLARTLRRHYQRAAR